jgi:hypothetical protein
MQWINTYILEYFNKKGMLGPLLIILISLWNLKNQKYYLIGYLGFFLINNFCNKLFNISINDSNPFNGLPILNENFNKYNKTDILSYPIQSVFFSLTYLYFVKQSYIWLLLELLIAGFTVYKINSMNIHKIEHLMMGSVLGIGIGFIGYSLINHWLIKSSIE